MTVTSDVILNPIFVSVFCWFSLVVVLAAFAFVVGLLRAMANIDPMLHVKRGFWSALYRAKSEVFLTLHPSV